MGTGERCVVCDCRAPDHAVDCSAAACRGATMILTERRRQIQVEGWSPEHDDNYRDGELVDAARAYAAASRLSPAVARSLVMRGDIVWPWHEDWWKPSDDPIKDLVRAGALIAAEIDRRLRAGASAVPSGSVEPGATRAPESEHLGPDSTPPPTTGDPTP